MARSRFSIRGLIVVVAVAGFDLAAIARAVRLGRAAHDVAGYVVGFGLVLLILNGVILGLLRFFAKRGDLSRAERLSAPPPPLVILGLYAAVLSLAILSVLFFTSGRI